MFDEYPLTVPAGTAQASPAELEAKLAPGTVKLVAVQFPPGCRGLVSAAIFRGDHQVWPGDPDEGITADATVVWWPEDYDLDDEPYGFTVKGWSPETTFQHVLTFRFAVLPLEARDEARESAGLLRRIGEAIFGG